MSWNKGTEQIQTIAEEDYKNYKDIVFSIAHKEAWSPSNARQKFKKALMKHESEIKREISN